MGAEHGEERTRNMSRMSVTLEVSKLSGWLNADAFCRESKGGNVVQGEVYGSAGGRRRATTLRRRRKVAACRGGTDRRLGVGGTGGAHVEHELHVCDTGGDPA